VPHEGRAGGVAEEVGPCGRVIGQKPSLLLGLGGVEDLVDRCDRTLGEVVGDRALDLVDDQLAQTVELGLGLAATERPEQPVEELWTGRLLDLPKRAAMKASSRAIFAARS